MNIVKTISIREQGLKCMQDYNIALLRLKCYREDAYQGVSSNINAVDYNPKPPIFACKFSSTTQYAQIIALANEDGKFALQDTSIKYETEKPLEGIQAHNNAIFDIAWMPQELKLITASGDLTACLWDVSSEIKELQVFYGHTNSVKSVVFRNQDKAVFATGARDGAIMIWDIRANHSDRLKPDNTILNAHEIKVLHGRKQRKTLLQLSKSYKSHSVTALAFQDDYTLFSCSAGDGLIKAWDLRKNYTTNKKEPIAKYIMNYGGKSNTYNGFTSLLICPSSIIMYASCVDKKIYAYNLSSYNPNPIAEYYGHGSYNKMLSFFVKASLSSDGKYLASGSNDESAYIWHTKTSGTPLIKLSGHRDEVTCVAWCNTVEPKIVTCSDDSCHKIWQIKPEIVDEDEKINIVGYAENYKKQLNLASCNSSNLSITQINTINDIKRIHSNKHILSPIQEMYKSSPKRVYLDNHATRKLKFSTNTELVSSTSLGSSPTIGLPNFVIDGTAPHLSNSPRKTKENINWLTEMQKRKNACKNTIDKLGTNNKKTVNLPSRKINKVNSTELRRVSKNIRFMPTITGFCKNLIISDAKVT